MFLFKKEYCKCISMKHFKMKNTVNWESANVYHLNVSIFKGRIPMAKEPNLEKVLVTQSSPTLCDSMDCSLPGSMEFSRQGYWSQLVAIPFFKGSSRPIFPGRTWVSCIAGRFFTSWVIREPLEPHVIRTPQSRKDRQGRSEILLAFCWLNPSGWCTVENLNNFSLF